MARHLVAAFMASAFTLGVGVTWVTMVNAFS